ncbi:MAG TPA: MurT ligase domain-containing protein [Streptosporangiaceae bacterium]|nr:MurT ligase domain-containing protein [Streptosporangiaceae bacterium]
MLAVTVGKAARGTVRRLGRGGGSAMPGRAALAIEPRLLAGLAAELSHGAVIVSGTNGKGTTCRMLAGMMRASGLHPVINHEGSNQPSGLASTLLARAGRSGHLPADDRSVGVFEVDEGSLPDVLPQVNPAVMVFTNIFSDQMDRYLELDYLIRRLERGLLGLPSDATLVLNADDPRLAYLGSELTNRRIWFGLEDFGHRRCGVDHTSDFPRCPRCAGELRYSSAFYAQLGHWECGACGLARPVPQVRAVKADLSGHGSSRLQVVAPGTEAVLEVPLPGLYNAYNALAAAAAATACQLPSAALTAVDQVTSGCFRMERVSVDGHEVYLAMAKNPSGFTEVLRAVLADGQPRHLMLGLNDQAGKQEADVSWIWDVDFESLRGLVPVAVLAGNRASDLAVRLKYARWTEPWGETDVTVEPDPVSALRLAVSRAPQGEPVWVVSTDLVLRQLREWLRRRGQVGKVWER